jgi:hypothetical protein
MFCIGPAVWLACLRRLFWLGCLCKFVWLDKWLVCLCRFVWLERLGTGGEGRDRSLETSIDRLGCRAPWMGSVGSRVAGGTFWYSCAYIGSSPSGRSRCEGGGGGGIGGAGPVGVGVLPSIIGEILPLLRPSKPGLSWALRLCESVDGCEPSAEPGTGLISILGGLKDGAASLVRPNNPVMRRPGPFCAALFAPAVLLRSAGCLCSEISSTSDSLFSFFKTEPELCPLLVGVDLKREDEAMPPIALLSKDRFLSDCESASLAKEP